MTDEPTQHRRQFLAVAGAAAAFGAAGCLGDDDGSTGTSGGETTDSMGSTDSMDGTDSTSEETDSMDGGMAGHELVLSFENLEPLPSGAYEGWAVFGDETVSTGTFSVEDDLTFSVDRDLRAADRIVVTVEPANDMDPAPSGVAILTGTVGDDGTASLSFPADFGDAGGSYILATPTNGAGTAETAGVWFLEPPEPTASLTLPELPEGWVYEGWAVTQGTPVSTGRFRRPDEPDDFDGHSGGMQAPPFPGEDLLRNAPMGVSFPADLADGESRIVVSVEPDVDGADPTGEAPFQIKPLVGDVPAGVEDHRSYDLERTEGTVPSGTATIE